MKFFDFSVIEECDYCKDDLKECLKCKGCGRI